MGLKLKKSICSNEKEMEDIHRTSLITEVGFFIGTQTYIRDVIDEKLLLRLVGGVDEFIIFHFYCEFLVNRFIESDMYEIYDYVEEYFEEDLVDFIEQYFEKEGAKNGTSN